MSAPVVIKIIAENVTAEARALAPGDGRRMAAEVEVGGVRVWLENFAALPALETEEADARLHLIAPAQRLAVRRAGGRLGFDEDGSFAAATVEEIVARLGEAPAGRASRAEEAGPEVALPNPARARRRAYAAAVLLGIFLLLGWWSVQPETPEEVEWVSAGGERQEILTRAAGSYASDNEHLSIDAGSARLVATDAAGGETLRTSLRVGRRAGLPVLVTESGVALELRVDGSVCIGETPYRRVP